MLEILSFLKLEQIIIQTIAMSLTALLLPKLKITSIFGPLLTVISLATINILYWDVDLFLILPNTLNTKVLRLMFINGVLFWLIVKLLPGIEVEGIFTVFIAPIIFSILTLIVTQYAPLVPWEDILNNLLSFLSSIKEDQINQESSIHFFNAYRIV
jgi:uncharacterized membrane protein YvlD (DUF360 family)